MTVFVGEGRDLVLGGVNRWLAGWVAGVEDRPELCLDLFLASFRDFGEHVACLMDQTALP